MAKFFRVLLLFVLASGLTALNGCGGGQGAKSGRPRVNASGKAIFDGKPIPFGDVLFTHIESGNTSSCTITNGSYQSPKGMGPVIGENNVAVYGFEKEDGKALWSGTWSKPITIGPKGFKEDFSIAATEVSAPDPNYKNPDNEE